MSVKQINAGGGGDYTSLAAWHATLPASLTEPEIAEITGTLTDSNLVLGSGITTTAANNIIIRPATGQKYDYVADTGAKVQASLSWNDILTTATGKHIVIEDIGIINTHNINSVGVNLSSDTATIRRCYIEAKIGIGALYSGVVEYNTINCRNVSGSQGIVRNNWETPDIINNTVFNAVTGIDSTAANGSANVENNIVYGATTSYTSGNYTGFNNAASDGSTNTPPGTNPITTDVLSTDFVDAGGGDYHLTSGSSLKTGGATPTAGSGIDIDGDTITGDQPVGADWVDGGGSGLNAAVAAALGLLSVVSTTNLDINGSTNANLDTLTLNSVTNNDINGSTNTNLDQLTLNSVTNNDISGSTNTNLDQLTLNSVVTTGNNNTINGSFTLSDLVFDCAINSLTSSESSIITNNLTLDSTALLNNSVNSAITLNNLAVAAQSSNTLNFNGSLVLSDVVLFAQSGEFVIEVSPNDINLKGWFNNTNINLTGSFGSSDINLTGSFGSSDINLKGFLA